ncbi:hypothetical protein TRVL_10316 [Trypanosoma vivax]|nr:hypothetical protein TRVL_10316 [Trypanosoma vivax]
MSLNDERARPISTAPLTSAKKRSAQGKTVRTLKTLNACWHLLLFSTASRERTPQFHTFQAQSQSVYSQHHCELEAAPQHNKVWTKQQQQQQDEETAACLVVKRVGRTKRVPALHERIGELNENCANFHDAPKTAKCAAALDTKIACTYLRRHTCITWMSFVGRGLTRRIIPQLWNDKNATDLPTSEHEQIFRKTYF